MFIGPLRFVTLLTLAGASGALGAPAINLDREMVLTPQPGAAREDIAIRNWQQRAEAAMATAADFERLGWAFVAKARRTLDGGYFTLAEKTVAVSDVHFGATAGSRLLL